MDVALSKSGRRGLRVFFGLLVAWPLGWVDGLPGPPWAPAVVVFVAGLAAFRKLWALVALGVLLIAAPTILVWTVLITVWLLDFAKAIWNRVRGLVPWPGAFTYLPPIATISGMRRSVLPFIEGQPQSHLLKIWKAEVADGSGSPGAILRADKTGIVVGCGSGVLRVMELQREGGKRLSAHQFLSYRLAVGWVLRSD